MSVPAKSSNEKTVPRIQPRQTATSTARASKPPPPAAPKPAALGGKGPTSASPPPPAPPQPRRTPPSSRSPPPPPPPARPMPPSAAHVQKPKSRPQSAPKHSPIRNESIFPKTSRKTLSPTSSANECTILISDEQQPPELDLVSEAEAPPPPALEDAQQLGNNNTPAAASIAESIEEMINPDIETIAEAEEDTLEVLVEISLAEKRKMFHQMKKELDLKQEQLVTMYASLKESGEGAGGAGAGGGEAGEGRGQPAELLLLNVADWTADELAQLWRHSLADECTDICNYSVQPDENYPMELQYRLSEVPSFMAGICQQTLANHDSVLDWVRGLLKDNQEMSDDIETKLDHFSMEGQSLMELLVKMRTKAETDVGSALELSKRVWSDRGTLAVVGQSLVRDVARLRARVAELQEQLDAAPPPPPPAPPAPPGSLQEVTQLLTAERAEAAALREKLAASESQLRAARARTSKLDRQLKEAENSIATLGSTIKSMDEQNRQRDVQLESRARKVRDALKTSELSVSQLTQQRDALERRIMDATEEQRALREKHEAEAGALRAQLASLAEQYEERSRAVEREGELRRQAEQACTAADDVARDLREKLAKLERQLPDPDVPTMHEVEARAQMHAAQESLRLAEEQLAASIRDKMRYVETLTMIAEPVGEVTAQHKMAADLLSKEELIVKMQYQIRELTRNCNLNENKVEQYERHLSEMQLQSAITAGNTDGLSPASYCELQQEKMSLRMNLVEIAHQNEELTSELRQRELALEQQSRMAHSQTKLIKVREELINMLQNKETEQSQALEALQRDLEYRMQIVDDVNKQIASKAEEIHSLFSTLDNKQQEIHRREKIILALEEQLRRAQAQRTRHEEKIAALEYELADAAERRRAQDKRFLFF